MKAHMSNHQYGRFTECANAALAYAGGKHKYPDTLKMAGGTLGHFMVAGDETGKDEWIKKNWWKIGKKTGGGMYKDVEDVYPCVELAQSKAIYSMFFNDPEIEREVTVHFEMFGIEWEARIDMVHRRNRWIGDWKFVDSIWHGNNWMEVGEYEDGNPINRKVKIWIARHWWRQMAVYYQACIQGLGFTPEKLWIPCVSKEDPPDHELFDISRSN